MLWVNLYAFGVGDLLELGLAIPSHDAFEAFATSASQSWAPKAESSCCWTASYAT